jgi:hypothetical protein
LEDGAFVPASCESMRWYFSIGPTCDAFGVFGAIAREIG